MAKSQKRRGTPKRRPKRKPAPRPDIAGIVSRALARRPIPQAPVVLPPEAEEVRTITEGIALGELGLVELKLTAAEEAVLSEPAPVNEILIKPTRHPQPYLSHPTYTRWFNRAFGRTGWALVPVGRPALQGKSVVLPYVLHVHKQPVAFAMGEQDYIESNKEQTYGDALESTVASALRRCAKRLGVGLELWDRDFIQRWVDEHAIRVYVTQGGEKVTKWRRKIDRPFPYEIGAARDNYDDGGERQHEVRGGERGGGKSERQRQEAPREEYAGHHKHTGEPITDKQRKRLWVIVKNSGRGEEEVRRWLERKFGWTSTAEVTRDKYDDVWKAIEADGDLPR